MDDLVVDPNALLKQYEGDSTSRARRELFAEFERQRHRLVYLLRWYDHQQIARASELRREFEQVNLTKRRIVRRSKFYVKERAHLQHILDEDVSFRNTRPNAYKTTDEEDRKRKIYGCTLPHLKAPLSRSNDNWLELKRDSIQSKFDYAQLNRMRWSYMEPVETPASQQQNRIQYVLGRCVDQLEECSGVGYDHFLRTSKPIRNEQVLAQQNIDEKK